MNNVSIIVICQEQQQELRHLLPELLSMQYEGEIEVIVVDKQHDKDMEEWLEDMELHTPNLSHTFCPASSRGIDIHKLALTLGAKAAIYEWLALVPADVKLLREDWLKELVTCCNNNTDVAVGITDHGLRWNWFTSFRFRRRFSVFLPSASIILCRRSIILQGKKVKLSNRQIVKL